MLPTFVIGLREGLEAALIVGIVAAFLRQRGRTDLLRWALAGVAAAAALCLAIGIALEVISHDLPQREQEGLETVIGAVAVVMVTYMVVWMRRHARTLKAQLEGAAGHALAAGSGFALVLMAFLAVLREGLETVVFLLAAFNQSGSGSLAALGAVLGIALAIVLGWGVYRGGVRLNLAKFFRITGVVLTFVAAGLVVSALHTAHEAGWLNVGQQRTFDITAVVDPGSVQAALLTGMLGLQPRPVLIEVIGWLLYVIPVGLYVAIPPSAAGPRISRALARRALLAGATLTAVAAIVLVVVRPGDPGRNPVTRTADGASAQVVSLRGATAEIAATVVHPQRSSIDSTVTTLTAVAEGDHQVNGVSVELFTATVTGAVAGGPSTMTFSELAQRNGGRLPLGVRAGDGTDTATVTSRYSDVATFTVEPRTGRVVDVEWKETTTLTAQFGIGPTVIGSPSASTWQLPQGVAADAVAGARADGGTLDNRSLVGGLAITAGIAAGLCLLLLATTEFTASRRDRVDATGPRGSNEDDPQPGEDEPQAGERGSAINPANQAPADRSAPRSALIEN
jgi:high-affinity iron transporter